MSSCFIWTLVDTVKGRFPGVSWCVRKGVLKLTGRKSYFHFHRQGSGEQLAADRDGDQGADGRRGCHLKWLPRWSRRGESGAWDGRA